MAPARGADAKDLMTESVAWPLDDVLTTEYPYGMDYSLISYY